MPAVFLDANIFFAAVRSHTGGSYFILELAKKKRLRIVTVAHAVIEAERNIEKKLGRVALNVHYQNLLSIRPTIQPLVMIPRALEARLMSVMVEKDLPIVLGTLLSNADALITLDQKHFLKNERLKDLPLPFSILTPGDFIRQYLQ